MALLRADRRHLTARLHEQRSIRNHAPHGLLKHNARVTNQFSNRFSNRSRVGQSHGLVPWIVRFSHYSIAGYLSPSARPDFCRGGRRERDWRVAVG